MYGMDYTQHTIRIISSSEILQCSLTILEGSKYEALVSRERNQLSVEYMKTLQHF